MDDFQSFFVYFYGCWRWPLALASGPPTRLCRGGVSGGIGRLDDDNVVSLCDPIAESDAEREDHV